MQRAIDADRWRYVRGYFSVGSAIKVYGERIQSITGVTQLTCCDAWIGRKNDVDMVERAHSKVKKFVQLAQFIVFHRTDSLTHCSFDWHSRSRCWSDASADFAWPSPPQTIRACACEFGEPRTRILVNVVKRWWDNEITVRSTATRTHNFNSAARASCPVNVHSSSPTTRLLGWRFSNSQNFWRSSRIKVKG